MAGKNNRDEIARRAREQWEQEQERKRQEQSAQRSQAVYSSYQQNTDRAPDRTPATGMPTWKIAAQAKKNVEKGTAHGYTPPGNYSRPFTNNWKSNYEKYLQSAKAQSVELGGDSDEVYNRFVQGLKDFTSGKARQTRKNAADDPVLKRFDAQTRGYKQPLNADTLMQGTQQAYEAGLQDYWAQNGDGSPITQQTRQRIESGDLKQQFEAWGQQKKYKNAQDYYGRQSEAAQTTQQEAQGRVDRAYQQLQRLGLSIPDGFPDEDGAWENHILQTYAPSSREYQLAQEMIDAKSRASEAGEAAEQTGKWAKNYEDYLTTAQNMQKVYSYPQEVQDALLAYGQTATSGNDDARASTAREGALQVFQKYGIEPEEYERLAESAARDYNQRRSERWKEAAQKFGGSGWAPAAWVTSVLSNTAGGVLGATQALGQTLNPGSGQYNSPDTNAPGYLLSDFGGTIQDTQATGIKNFLGGWRGKTISTVYSGITSLADNIVRYGLGAATGTAGVTLGLAATSSFASSYREAAARGGDATQATLFGLASGALEVATEKFSLDNLLKMKSPETIAQALLQAAAQGGVEVSEEEASYFGGLLADAIIMQGNSEYKTRIREYERQGLTEEEAKRSALRDALMEAADTAAVSFISGSLMGGIQSANRYRENVRVGQEIKDAGLTDLTLEYARSMPEDSDAYKMATRPEGAKNQITQDSKAGRIGALATETLTEATRTIWNGSSIAQVMDAFNTIRNIGSEQDVQTALNLMMEKYYQAAANGEITQQQAQKIVEGIVWRTSPQNFTEAQSEEAASAGQSPTPQTVSGPLGQESQSQASQEQAEAGLLPSGEENAQREALLDQLENYRQEMAQEAQGMGLAGLADTDESVGPEADLSTFADNTNQRRGAAAQAKRTETAQESPKGKNGKLTATRAAVEAPAVTTGGEEITITGATVTEGGKLRLLSSSGEAYDPKAVHIQNPQMRQLYSQAAQYGGNIARNYISNYNGSQDVTEYTDGYNAFLTAGRLAARDNLTYEQAQAYNSYYEQKIGTRAAMEAFSVGRDSEGTQTLARRQTARPAEGSLTDRTSRKAEGQDALVEALSQWAKRTGVHLELLDSINAGGEKANGSFVASTLSMALSTDSDNILQAFGHEAAEFVQAFSPEEKAALRQDLMEWWTNHESANSMDALIRKYRGAYSQVEGKKSYNDAADEIVNDALGALLTTDEGIESFAKWVYSDTGRTQAEKKTLVQRIKDAIARIVAGLKRLLKGKKLNEGTERFLNMELEQQEALRQKFYSAMDAAAKNAKEGNYWESGTAEGAQFSIGYDANNVPFVKIDEELFADVPKRELGAAVRSYLKDNYPNGVEVAGKTFLINAKSRGELTNSKDARALFDRDPTIYRDKMEAVSRADEIANAIVDYVNESPAHARKDSITEFARGKLHFQVGQSGYAAEAVVAKRNNGELLLYDIVHLTQYKIKEKRSKLPQALADSANASIGESASDSSIRSNGENVKENFSLTADEGKALRGAAVEHFGKTYRWNETGYLLTNGTKLDFSGRHEGGSGGYRSVDHRDILDIYPAHAQEELSGTEAMVDFMQRGNIRISPESAGINLAVQPTQAQESALDDFISRNRGEVVLDIDDGTGKTVSSTEYPRGTRASKVLNDIRQYFESGETPHISDVARFHYSLKPNSDATSPERWENAEKLDPQEITTQNEVRDPGMRDYLVQQFEENGWDGRPIVAYDNGGNGYVALTGSHRVAAAAEAGIQVPAVLIESQEAINRLADTYSDEERATVADELLEEGEIDQATRDLLVRENDLNSENFDVPYSQQARYSVKSGADTPSQEQRWATDFQLSAETREAYNTAAKEVARTEAEVRAMVREAQASGALAGQMNQGRRMAKQNRTLQERLDASRETIKQLKAETRAGNRAAKTAERQLSAKEKELQRQRERMEAKLNKAEANLKAARQRLEDYKDIRDERDRRVQYRKEIEQTAGKLRTMLTDNSQRRHIPEEMKGAVRELLLGIDQSSATMSSSEGAVRTKADERFLSGLEKLRNLQVDSVENGGSIDMPPALRDMLSEQIRIFRYAMDQREAIRDGGIATLQGMSAAELRSLRDVVKAVYTSVNNANRILASSRFAYVSEAAEKTISELAQLGSRSTKFDEAKIFLKWSNTNPWFAFQRFGAGGKAIFEGLQNGWDKLAFNSDAVKEYAASVYTAKEAKAWKKEIHRVELSNGQKIVITTPQNMDLYELAKREQALRHLLQGGARISDIQDGKELIAQTEAALLTQADLTNLAKRLTPRQIEVADKLQNYIETQGGRWGNEVSMTRFGYMAFRERGYMPIQSDQTNLDAKDPGAKENSITRLLNMGFTKSLNQNASNAIVVEDIFDVFSDHMSEMAKYNAMAIPVLDAMKWYNYRTRSVNEQGQISTKSVQRSLETAYGRGAGNYFLNLMKDLNGVSDGGREDGLFNRMLSNYKVAAVAGNVRVALLQFTAYLRAGAVMNPKYLAKAIKMGSNWREMERYSGIAKWKALGFYDTNIGRGMREQIEHAETWKDVANEKLMLGAEWGDRLAWGFLWNACKAETMDKQHLTGEALLQATELRFRDVVYQTQVVDSTLTRSQVMRSKSFVAKTTTAFQSEATLSYNLLLQGYEQYREDVRRGMPRAKALAKNWKAFMPAFLAYLANGVLSALVESFWDAVRDDDRYKNFGEKLWDAFWGWGGNLEQDLNPLRKIPVLKDVLAWLDGYDNERTEMAGIKGIIDFARITVEEIGLRTGLTDKATDLTYNDKMTAYGYIYKGLKAFSSTTGLPLSNLTRDVIAIWNTVIGQPTGRVVTTYAPTKEAEIQYAFQDGYLTRDEAIALLQQKVTKDNGKPITEDEAYWKTVRWETGEGKNGRLLHAFEAGDEGEIQDALKELKEHGNDESKNQSAVKSVLKELYTGGQLDEAQARAYLTKYAGLSEEKEFYQLFEKWGYWMENDTAEGFTVYEDLHAAIDAGKDIKAAKAELVKNGFEEKTVDSQVLSYIGEAYKKGASRADTEKRLKQYCGMDKDEVYWKMREYDFKIANPKQDYEKYGSFDQAVRSGQNLKSAIKEYTSHGIEEKTLASQITRLYKDELVELAKKNKSKAADLQAKILNAYVALGYDRDQKLKDVQAWYKDTGKKK